MGMSGVVLVSPRSISDVCLSIGSRVLALESFIVIRDDSVIDMYGILLSALGMGSARDIVVCLRKTDYRYEGFDLVRGYLVV